MQRRYVEFRKTDIIVPKSVESSTPKSSAADYRGRSLARSGVSNPFILFSIRVVGVPGLGRVFHPILAEIIEIIEMFAILIVTKLIPPFPLPPPSLLS